MILYTIHGYEKMVKGDKLMDTTEIIVHAENGENAIEKAKSLIKKKFYRIARIHEETHQLQEEIQIAQLEAQSKLLKALK